ncbi:MULTISPECIES: response regulator [unclassified Frigoribacterium]|uniref:response regulator n=1 Tax=unclassified Frigoribacterium TaxID=2627005 RepID=UPI000ABD83AC|nr:MULTISPECIES: response regulator [unclassified Frigoribacterium]
MTRASSSGDRVRVLVVEDEPLTAEAHVAYLERLDGFEVVGRARDGRETLDAVRTAGGPDGAGLDLVLLDMNLPDTHGLQLCRALRAAGSTVDVIAITAVRDAAVVRTAVSLGIVQYLIKPFTFATFADRLGAYRSFRESLAEGQGQVTQSDVDSGFATLRRAPAPTLAKGLAPATLEQVVAVLRRGGSPSAGEVADAAGVSRVTARRYLEHLADTGAATREPRYGSPGRPEHGYRWN